MYAGKGHLHHAGFVKKYDHTTASRQTELITITVSHFKQQKYILISIVIVCVIIYVLKGLRFIIKKNK